MREIIDFDAVMRDQMMITSGRINPSTVRMLIDMGFRITKDQPIYDEAKERELFESFQVDEGGNIDFENGYYDNVFVQSAWDGWKACAQSRAKSVEVGDE